MNRSVFWTLSSICVALLIVASPSMAATPEKITGPWLWTIAETPQCGKDGTQTDWLAEGGTGTEADAAMGAGLDDWVELEIPAEGGDNVGVLAADNLAADNDAPIIDNAVAYSYIKLNAPTAQGPVDMHVGSDDAIKVWMNGEVVWENPVNRGAGDFQEWFEVSLNKGDNHLLVAVYECGGGWSMFAGIDADYSAGGKDYKSTGEGMPPAPGDKIVDFLWTAIPTPDSCGKDATGKDWLAEASGGKVTEKGVSTSAPRKGNVIGTGKWTHGVIADTGGNNLNELLTEIGVAEEASDNIVSYGVTHVFAKATGDYHLFTGSDDAIKVWINGDVVQEVQKNRGAGDFQEHQKVKLNAGDNIMLVAVYECGGGWSQFVGFDQGLTYDAIAPVQAKDKLVTTWATIKNR